MQMTRHFSPLHRFLHQQFLRLPQPVRPLRLILTAYFVIAVLYALATPAFEVSDEPLHVALAQHLANDSSLPIQQTGLSMEQAPWQQEGSQPPLYYAILAAMVQPFDRSDFALTWRHNPHSRQGRADAFDNFNQMLHPPTTGLPTGNVLAWTLLRLFGVLCGGVAVAATWSLALLFSGRTDVAALAAGLTAFNPMFVHIMASVNNDTLATALVSCALLLGARQLTSPPTLRRSLLLGFVLGCAALTKVSGLVVATLIPGAVLLRMATDGRGRPSSVVSRPSPRLAQSRTSVVILHALALALPIAAIAGWWYVRNLQLYGDPTGTFRMAEVAGLRTAAPSALQLLGEWEGFYMAYWGLFGAVNIALPAPIYDALEILLALGGCGLLLIARDEFTHNSDGQRRTSYSVRTIIAVLCATVLAATFAAFLRWTSITLASQGRLLFPVIAATSTLWAAGLLRLVNRPAFAACIVSALAALTLAAQPLVIQPAFARPARLAADAPLPTDLTPTELVFDGQIRWIGYRVNTPAARVGDDRTLDVSLYMQALAPTAKDTTLFVRVLQTPATDPTAIAFYKSPGGGGMYEMQYWRPNEIVVERIRIRLPDEFSLRATKIPALVQSALAIDVGFIDAAGRFLETTDAGGSTIGRPNYTLAAIAPTPAAAQPTAALARFERAELIAGTAQRTQISADAVDVSLRWRATADFPEEYTVFVHLYAGDILVAQADGPAASGNFPTRWWRTADVVSDVRRIPLPADLSSTDLTVRVGLYRPQGDFARMPGVDATGAPLPNAAVNIHVQD